MMLYNLMYIYKTKSSNRISSNIDARISIYIPVIWYKTQIFIQDDGIWQTIKQYFVNRICNLKRLLMKKSRISYVTLYAGCET